MLETSNCSYQAMGGLCALYARLDCTLQYVFWAVGLTAGMEAVEKKQQYELPNVVDRSYGKRTHTLEG